MTFMPYIIVQEGVYRHAIYGPWRLEETARAKAQRLAAGDHDGYHEWVVYDLKGGVSDDDTGVASYRKWDRTRGEVERDAYAEHRERGFGPPKVPRAPRKKPDLLDLLVGP